MEAELSSGALIQGRCRNLVELRAHFTPDHPDTGLGILAVASSVSRRHICGGERVTDLPQSRY
jgi:hypothetical protein